MATHSGRAALLVSMGAVAGFIAAQLFMQTPAPLQTPPPRTSSSGEPAGMGVPVRVKENAFSGAPREPSAAPPSSPSTLAGILRIDSDFEQTAALYDLVRSIGFVELERLIAEADSVPGASDRRAALSILYARYADLDPAAALNFLERRGGSHGDVELRAIFHAWSRDDLTSAVEAAAGLPREMRSAAGIAILLGREDLSSSAQRDIAGRLGVEEILPQLAMQRSLDQVDRDPQRAWQAALSASGPLRHQQLAGVAQAWAREDPLAAMQAATSLASPELRTQLETQILHEWSRRSPQQAVDWALSQPASPRRRQLVTVALSTFAESEPRLAFDIAQGLSGQERVHAVGQVLSRWAAHDPVGAARSIDSVTNDEARLGAIGSIAYAYVRQDPEGALQWLGSLDRQEASRASLTMFTAMAQRDPAEAGRLVNRLPDDQVRAQAAGSVAQAWVQHDPEGAAQWVDSLVDDDVRARALGELTGHWSRFDRESAVRYAERLHQPAERDAALVAIIQRQHSDVDFAEQLFDRLTEPDQRALAARMLYFNLRQTDPSRAEAYRELAGIRGDPAASR